MNTKIDTVSQTLQDMGLTIESKFIPFSQSRNKAEKYPSLNWLVTLKYKGKEVITTDYMAGCAHCPSYNQKNDYNTRQALAVECESGYTARPTWSEGNFYPDKKKPIFPKIEDVVYSLVMDSDVIEYDFPDWCSNFGYEEDSRKAESIYKQCQDIALKMIRSLGTDNLNTLREVYQDY